MAESKSVNIDPILSQVGLQHKAVGRVSLDHVGVRLVMPAEGKTSRGPLDGIFGPTDPVSW